MRKFSAHAVWLVTSLLLLGLYAQSQSHATDRILRAIDSSDLVRVPGTEHPVAHAGLDRGRVAGTRLLSGVSLEFRLSPSQQSDLDRLLQEQQDPSSTNYHKWVTTDEYAHRFGMTQNDLAKVTAWLQSQGLRVDEVSPNRTSIAFSGTVSQIEHALQTELHNYSIHGVSHFANATPVALPSAFAAQIGGVRNLNDFHPKPRLKPAPHFTSSLSGNHFLMPGDFATIYNLGTLYSQGLDGSGQAIAVIGQTLINVADVRAFRSASGLSQNDPTLLLVPGTGTGSTCSGDVSEADLDVEWSGGVAKGASIVYAYSGVGTGGTCSNRNKDVFDAMHYVINNKINGAYVPVISISYGLCEASVGPTQAGIFRQWFQQANSQGQTIVSAAGDDGAADCDFGVKSATHGLAVDFPASTPEVTGMGGTTFTGDGQVTVANGCAPADPYWAQSCSPTSLASALSYIPETAWNDPVSTGFSATGGGASAIFTRAQAPWQTQVPGVPADGKRDVPDVSLNASPSHDPYLFCTQGSCVTGFRDSGNNLSAVGGTSAGAPSFAGIVAIINQATQSVGQGNVNPTLYGLAVSTAGQSAFHDTQSGNNKVPCTSGSTGCPSGGSIGFTAGANYDQATGLGTINAFNLVTSWPGFVATPAFSLSASSKAITIATAGLSGSTTLNIGGSNGFSGTVALTCAVPSSATTKISCGVAPSSVPLDSTTTTGTATLTINALASSGALQPHNMEVLAATVLLPGILFLVGPFRRRGDLLFSLIAVGLLGLATGCGGGSSTTTNPNQAATYAVTVTATSGTSHTITVNVTVK